MNSPNHFQPPTARVVATIHDQDGLAEARHVGLETASFLEVRADLVHLELLEQPTALNFALPLILTIRSITEGGAGSADDAERVSLFLHLMGKAQIIDIELASRVPLAEVVSRAQSKNTPVIMSTHDFTGTPPVDVIRRKIDDAVDGGAALCKIATTLHSVTDLCRLLSVFEFEPAIPLALMGMGKYGKISRLLLAQIGSRLNYGYLSKPLVDGQWPAARLTSLIKETTSQ